MTYFVSAGGHVLEAWSAREAAELVDCALDAGDELHGMFGPGGRLLSADEFLAVMAELARLRSGPDREEP